MSSVQDLSNQIADLRESYEAEKIRSGVAQSELEAVRRQLQQCREQLEGGGGGGGGGGGTHDVMLQLKSEVSRLTGQTSELRAQLSRSEQGRERAARELERRTCEVGGRSSGRVLYNYCFRKALLHIIIALFINSVGVLILLLLAD